MIKINALKAFWQDFADKNNLGKIIPVASESQLAARIKEIEAKTCFIVMVIPKAVTSGINSDIIHDNNHGLIYILTKLDQSDFATDDEFTDEYDSLQIILDLAKTEMISNKDIEGNTCHLFKNLDTNSMNSEPEYNYLGCYGWSLSYSLRSNIS